jgi:pyruvate kinase
MRRTKIIGTIGPASDSEAVLKKLIQAGLNVVRLNMSHGDRAYHRKVIRTIRKLEKELGTPIAILLDLQGPRLRTGMLKGKTVNLLRGNRITFSSKQIIGTANRISTNYKNLYRDVGRGDRILLDNGFIELKVIKTVKKEVVCEVVEGGSLGENKGINLPNVSLSTPNLSQKDRKDLSFAISQKADYVAVSFVHTPQDVLKVKNIIKRKGSNISVIAKVEKPQAVKNIFGIIDVSDGIMIARGDLGVEMSAEAVPVIQKEIIEKCNRRGNVVITATQMLESMMEKMRPTRAEASDVANAVFDGTDALMLSGEVAVGKHPVKAVQIMGKIAMEAEREIIKEDNVVEMLELKKINLASAVGHAAASLAEDLAAKAIVTFTSSGSTALLISKYRPDAPIYTITDSLKTARKTCLFWGTKPIVIGKFMGTDEMFKFAEKTLLKMKIVRKGDIILTIAGLPVKSAGTTNLIRIQRAACFSGTM